MTDNELNETSLTPLLGLPLEELSATAVRHGLPRFAGKQIAQWLYKKHAGSFDEMTNLSRQARQVLNAYHVIGRMEPIEERHSADGTSKYLFPIHTGQCVETVFIPDGDRGTACVSCQVGCKMGCAFCLTGRQGFQAQLTTADIVNQILSLPERDRLTNVVFMGQGEPMDNLDAVLRATEVLTAQWGYAWSPKRITVSTVGIRGKLKRFIEESQCHLAVSLHAPSHEQRASLMPAEKAMGIEEVVALLRNYDFSHQRRLSFEYIVFSGLNDSHEHARQLLQLLNGLDCRINLIRFHQTPGVPLPATSEASIQSFCDYLTRHGIFTTIRASRGQDIYAACGLLSTARKAQQQH